LNLKATIIAVLALLTVESFAQTPQPDFKSDITSGCSPIVVNFTDLSTGNPTSWLWDFGTGATSSKKNPSTSFINPGTYNIKLTVTNANGSNSIIKSGYITVYNEPVVEFSASKTSGCSPAVITFTDQSSTPAGTNIIGWKWDFGDGLGTSTAQNPTYVYKKPGSYTVTLTVFTDKGCQKLKTKPNYINITTGVSVAYDFVDPGVCKAPETVGFTNNSSGPGNLSYVWNFGDGGSSTAVSPGHYYTTNGMYNVNLYVVSDQGCSDSLVRQFQVGRVLTDFIIPASLCPKTTVTFLNNSAPRPLHSLWKFPGGRTDTLRNGQTIFPSTGTFDVTLINNYTTCTDTLIKQVTILPPPVISFTASDTGKCKPSLTVNFNNTTNGSSYVWDFGDSTSSTQTSPAHTYNNYGSYNVTLIAKGANGCIDTLVKPAYIRIRKPVISFPGLPAKGCYPFTFNFQANVDSPDSVLTYQWNFGDTLGTSNQKSPTYTYTKPGTFAVTLTITTTGGCTETYTLANAVKIGPKPVANFTSNTTTACANPGIQFINQSTGAIEYLWEFSDGSTSTAKDPLQTFNDTGWINVTLSAINNGCEDKITKTHYAYIRPSVSKFDYQPDCSNNLKYTFTDKSISATTWSWNFGDGTTYTGQNPPIHIFPSASSYDVSLTTTNGSCTYTLTRTIVIKDLTPDFTVSNNNVCKGFSASFNATSPNQGAIKHFVWDFGEGGAPVDMGTSPVGSHFYSTAGHYTVSLNTVDSFGCSHSITKTDYMNVKGPKADFASVSNSGCKGMTTTFYDSTKTNGGSVVSWTWDFGDSVRQNYSTPPFQHNYDSIGDYDVKLIVTDSNGCQDSIIKRGFVKVSSIKADFNTPIGQQMCVNKSVTFNNQSRSDLPFSSLWSLGDNSFDTTLNSYHTYSDTGYFTIKLVITDIVGCKDSVIKDSFFHIAMVKADFTANNFTSYCTPFQASFTNTSYFFSTSFWDLANGTSDQNNPTTYYTATGTYPVKLVATGPGGCQDSITKTVTVYNPNDATLSYTPLNGCTPRQVNFDAFTPMNARFIWDFGDGNVNDTTINHLSHTYVDFGDFVPVVIMKEPSGNCTVALQGDSTIKMIGVKLKYFLDKTFFCDSGTVSIRDSTTSNDSPVNYQWNFGDGGSSNVSAPTHLYQAPGSYNVSLLATTQNGCVDSMNKGPIKVSMTPVLNVNPDSIICVNSKLTYLGQLVNPDTSAVSWFWRFPNGSTSNAQNPGSIAYTVPGSFTWMVRAMNSSGCADSINGSLLVNPLPTVTIPASITKMIGIPLKIPATYSSGVTKYTWSGPANTLDCDNCPQPVTTTKFNTKYSVAVTDSNGCSARADVQVIVLCKGAKIFVPNTFSPNGDGTNDVFYVRGTGLDRMKSLRVFNRWGEVVFEQRDFPSNNEMYGWDGKYKGRIAQPGVYIYQVEVYCENGEIIHFEGNLSLIQ
jgi:gliding motility-associated-like protein